MAAGHTITIIPANRHIQVHVGGQKLAESDRAMRLDETGLPARYYTLIGLRPENTVRAAS